MGSGLLVGFYFLLAFVGSTIPAGIYREEREGGGGGAQGCACVGTQGKSKHKLTSHTHSLGVGLLG
jgi:hypothetical protein